METIKLKLTKANIEHIEKTIDSTVSEFIKNLPTIINRKLESIVFQTLGFTDRWGDKVEIDHCNGREPFVAQYINEASKKVCADLVSKFNFTPSKDVEKAIATEYARKMQDQLDYTLNDLARANLKTTVEKLVDAGEIKFEQIVKPTKAEAADPNNLSKFPKLRDIIYADMVGKENVKKSD